MCIACTFWKISPQHQQKRHIWAISQQHRVEMADEEESGAKFGSWVGSREGEAPHGDGTGTYPNGDVYTGSMVHGQREGQGK